MIYTLSNVEQTKLQQAIESALKVPFIAGVEGYIFESIFHYVKDLPLSNPHSEKRSKLLFDCVDAQRKIGWSLKAVQKSPETNSFELVIQRADILKKKLELGFPTLALNSTIDEIGNAILRHWNQKIEADMLIQRVESPRIAILIKSNNHKRYAILEQDLHIFSPDELYWKWTDELNTGLQARRKSDNSVALRWYPNQKQLFESFQLPQNSFRFEINPTAMSANDFIETILHPTTIL